MDPNHKAGFSRLFEVSGSTTLLLLRGLSHPCVDTNPEGPVGSVICVRRAAHSLEHARQGVDQGAMLTRQRFFGEAPVIGTWRPGV